MSKSELAQIQALAKTIYKDKLFNWYQTIIPYYGMTPKQLIKQRKYKAVLQYLDEQKDKKSI